MNGLIHSWFELLCIIGFCAYLTTIFRFLPHRGEVDKKIGPVPIPMPLILFIVLGLIVLSGFAELGYDLPVLRILGIVLSFFPIVLIPWTWWTLGRQFIPGAAVLRDHELMTSGPFSRVRNPLLAGLLAFWLGAALGTLNWLLLALWPLLFLGVSTTARHEEHLLGERFGEAYASYMQRAGRFLPKL